MNKLYNFICDKKIRFNYLTLLGFYNKTSDKEFLKKKWKVFMGGNLDIDNPRTFNEKLQWLKINDRKDIYSTMVDKYEVKKYVGDIIGNEHIIPTLGVYDNFDEIDFEKLPSKFVIKCTHNSGQGMYICKDKSKIEINNLKKIVEKGLKYNYYMHCREWAYRNVKPRIIIEKYMGDDLVDYRFYCFNGEVKYIYQYINESRTNNLKPEPVHCNIYDVNWKLQKFHQASKPTKKKYSKPKTFDEMMKYAVKLSKNCPFVRVDFYEINGLVFFGELTFYPGGGLSKFYPSKYDNIIGDFIDIKKIKSKKN